MLACRMMWPLLWPHWWIKESSKENLIKNPKKRGVSPVFNLSGGGGGD